MNKKKSILVLTIIMLATMISCNNKKEDEYSENMTESFNNYYYVRMDDGIIYRKGNTAMLLDCESMNSTLLCNVPNCSHTTSSCLLEMLKSDDQLPMIYNGAAYFFTNSNKLVEHDGKNTLELSFSLKKYDFEACELSNVVSLDNFNVNSAGGCYLIGSEYYFTTNIGNPSYDELGNVISYNSGGGGNLLSINLDSGKVTDYGQIFDYEALKKEYPSVQNSLTMYLMGKIENKLYIGINYIKNINNIENNLWSGQNFTFDINTKKIEKLDDYFSMCTMNGYHTFYDNEQNKKISVQDVNTGEIYEGPDITSWNAMTIFDDKVWHDNSMCFDIKTGEEIKISSNNDGIVIAEYNDSYIFMGSDEKGKTTFEKLSKSEIK